MTLAVQNGVLSSFAVLYLPLVAEFGGSHAEVAVVQSAGYRDMAEKAGTIALSSTPEELAKILAETYEQTARISKEFGLQL